VSTQIAGTINNPKEPRSETMRLQRTFVVLASAAVTTVFTLSLLVPSGVDAVDTMTRIKPLIDQPRFLSQGCGFVLKTNKVDYEAGDTPAIEVTASNPTGKTVTTTVWVNILASAPASPASRMLPVPRTLCSHPCVFSLKPGASATLSITSEAKLPAGQDISISITDKQRAILASSLSTPRPKVPVGPPAPATLNARLKP
jgi:hypothetical protein